MNNNAKKKTAAKWRAIDLHEVDELALGELLREAVAYNIENTVPKSRGSRV